MRWYTVLAFILCLQWGQILAAPADFDRRDLSALETLDRRADPDPSQTATDIAATKTNADTTATTTTDSKPHTTAASTTTDSASTTRESSVETSVPSVDGDSASGSVPSNSSKNVYEGGLPIQPTITPALGVAGFILILAGAVLTFIGIRKPRIYIFLSTALLAALGVTVLIEYVQSPPVSNAVQGGYLVAIFFTGAVFGGLALVFKEITEGLCCLLGGFCIGMWFMTVKAGGLVTNSGAKVGFIIAFAAGFYCLSWSHYTRAYGSILCTSFGGATALVLGIDCFSRAGLKEFWLYIWDMNENMFPLHTNTYPITRNIRVELAIIIIISVFGVIAQLRLWKVIKERRDKEAAAKREAQRQNEEAEAEVSRQLQEKNLHERAEWENMYGHGIDAKTPSMSETAVADDSRRGSDSFASSPENGSAAELRELTSPEQSTRASDCGNTLEVVEEDVDEHAAEGDAHDVSGLQADHPEEQQAESVQTNEKRSRSTIKRAPTPDTTEMLRVHPRVPEDDGSEHGAVLGSEAGVQRSEHLSGRAFEKRKSGQSLAEKSSCYSQADEIEVPHPLDTSSVAGMVDDLSSISRTSSMDTDLPGDEDVETTARNYRENNAKVEADGSNSEQDHLTEINVHAADMETKDVGNQPYIVATKVESGDEKSDVHEALEGVHSNGKGTVTVAHEHPQALKAPTIQGNEKPSGIQVDGINSANADSAAASENPKPVNQCQDNAESQDEVEASKANDQPEKSSVDSSKQKKRATLDMSTVQGLPEQTSRIVNSFRTQEWARHLADADVPDMEPLQFEKDIEDASSPEPDEDATPVDMHGLLQTPLDAAPPPITAVSNHGLNEDSPSAYDQSRRVSRMSMQSPELHQPKKRHSMHNVLTTQAQQAPRNVSSGSAPDQKDLAAIRNSMSTPYLTISTTQEKEKPEFQQWGGPAPLLAVRENMVRNRMSSTSLRYDPYGPRSQSRQSLADPIAIWSPTSTIPEEQESEISDAFGGNEDDMPLSQRRALLRRQTIHSPSSTSVHSIDSSRLPLQTYTSRESGRSAADMAAWRQSMRENISQKRGSAAFTSSPVSPSTERPRSKVWGSVQQMRDASNAQLGNSIAEGMQRGDMTDLHRKAMRRMQASANKKI